MTTAIATATRGIRARGAERTAVPELGKTIWGEGQSIIFSGSQQPTIKRFAK